MNSILNSVFNKMSFVVTCLVLSNVNAYVIGNKLTKSAANGQSNIAYSQDNKGSYQFAYEVTDKGGATNFRQETGGPKAVKGSYGLTDVDGRTRLVNYQADKFGFVATVDTNEPGTGREDSANAAYNGPDKGKGWAYAVAISDNQNTKTNKNKYDGSTYQTYSYSNNFDDSKYQQNNNNNDEGKYQSNNNNNDEQYNEKNYDRRDEYKNPVELAKPVLNQKSSTDSQPSKKDDQIKNVQYEIGGHFDTSNVPSSPSSNSESEKNYEHNDQPSDQPKAQQEDNSDNLDDRSEEEPYEKRQMHLIHHPKASRSDYLTTIDKLANKDKKSSSQSSSSSSKKKSSTTNSIKNDKVISKLISLSSQFDDGTWTNEKYVK